MRTDELHGLIDALCDGDDDAYHTLLEANHEIVPLLIQQFRNCAPAERRASIIEIIWQHGLPSTIPFLASTLDDPTAEVWKQALDGIVTIGGVDALNMLRDAERKLSTDSHRRP